jgi:hypothetical protein
VGHEILRATESATAYEMQCLRAARVRVRRVEERAKRSFSMPLRTMRARLPSPVCAASFYLVPPPSTETPQTRTRALPSTRRDPPNCPIASAFTPLQPVRRERPPRMTRR